MRRALRGIAVSYSLAILAACRESNGSVPMTRPGAGDRATHQVERQTGVQDRRNINIDPHRLSSFSIIHISSTPIFPAEHHAVEQRDCEPNVVTPTIRIGAPAVIELRLTVMNSAGATASDALPRVTGVSTNYVLFKGERTRNGVIGTVAYNARRAS